jgi:hypothetical protein
MRGELTSYVVTDRRRTLEWLLSEEEWDHVPSILERIHASWTGLFSSRLIQ